MTGTRRILVAGIGFAAMALIVLARQAPPFRETSDGAILELYTLRALEGRLLVGPYSRFGWHHPGPLFFYLEAPWYWLSGLHTAGMQAGALAINLAALALTSWTIAAVRDPAGSPAAAAAILVSIAIYVIRSGELIVSVWNPHVIVLPMIAFLVVAARFAETGEGRLLLWLAAVGSFLVQTHLAMAPLVVVLGALVCVRQRAALRRRWFYPALLAAALWFPAILEQTIHRPGNLAAIVRFFAADGGGQTLRTAADAWATALTAALRPGFTLANGSYLVTDAAIAMPLAIVLIAGLVFVSARRIFDRFIRSLSAVSAIAIVVALAAATRIHDQIVDHEVFWMSALGAIAAGVVGAAVIGAVEPASHRRLAVAIVRPMRVAAWIGILFAAFVGFEHVMTRSRTTDDHSVDVLADQIEQYLDSSGVRRPLVHIDPPIWPIAAGSLLRIAKSERPFAVDRRWATVFGEWYAESGREDGELTISGSALQPRVGEGRR